MEARSHEKRLHVLSAHLTATGPQQLHPQQLSMQATRAEEAVPEQRPAPGGGKGTLTVVDNRSGKRYTVRVVGVGWARVPVWGRALAWRVGVHACPHRACAGKLPPIPSHPQPPHARSWTSRRAATSTPPR